MKFSTKFTANPVFPCDSTGVENFCQILKRFGTEFLKQNVKKSAKNTLSENVEKLNEQRAKEFDTLLWNAKAEYHNHQVIISFVVPEKSLIFKKKTKEEIEKVLSKAFKLHWQADKLLRAKDRDGTVGALLDKKQLFVKKVFDESISNIKIG